MAKEKPNTQPEGILGQISDEAITSMMEENRVFPVPESFAKNATIKSLEEYKAIYDWSVKNPEHFWSHMANQIDWYKKWDKFQIYDFKDKPEIRHFVGGKINVSYNCLDRFLSTKTKDKKAIIWQGEPDGDTVTYTYEQLYK